MYLADLKESTPLQGAFHDNFPGSRVWEFTGNSRAQKLNKAQTKRVNITGVTLQ